MKPRTSNPASLSLGFGLVPVKAGKPGCSDGRDAESHKPRILVVDDDPTMQRLLSTRLGAAHYDVTLVDSAAAALDSSVRARPHLVITELRMQPMNGLALLVELKSRWPDMTVIILTAYGTIPDAVRATQCGAFGFLVKPVDREELLGQVQRAIAASTFSRTAGDWRAGIVSRSKLMEARLAQANGAAAVNSPVLLTGQNGTGKELLARAIHAASPRRAAAFLTVRCKGKAEAQLEAELFGVCAAPDATASAGAAHAAAGGTLLLEEIGELPPRLQARLMHEVRTDAGSGSGADRRIDTRLICTTSQDLQPALAAGRFRQDLYYQINVMPIEVPPLGRRREDIPLLVSHFLEQATEAGGSKKLYTPKAIELLATTDWPGNVRQLFDLVKQNVALSPGGVMTAERVRDLLNAGGAAVLSYDEAREQFSRNYLADKLQRTAGNVSEAARLAKRNRSDFYAMLTRFRLNAGDFKTPGPEAAHVAAEKTCMQVTITPSPRMK